VRPLSMSIQDFRAPARWQTSGCRFRAGGDIAFLGGLVRHIIENDLFFRDYVVHFTNASCILREDFRDAEEGATGVFSGWNGEQCGYDRKSWLYDGDHGLSFPERDLTLQHPRCVLQTLRRHFARYTPEMVETIVEISPELFHKVAEALVAHQVQIRAQRFVTRSAGPNIQRRSDHSHRKPSCNCCSATSVGREAESLPCVVTRPSKARLTFQRSTITLPGYLPMPRGDGTETTLRDYLARSNKPTGLWYSLPAYFISLLKAYYGKNARRENDFGYDWVPKRTSNHSFFEYLYDMLTKNGRHVHDGPEPSGGCGKLQNSSEHRCRN